jgi:hypothetical protein
MQRGWLKKGRSAALLGNVNFNGNRACLLRYILSALSVLQHMALCEAVGNFERDH